MQFIQEVVFWVFLFGFAYCGWIAGHRDHKKVEEHSHDAVRLPVIMAVLFGKPGIHNHYHIRGIYLQLFMIVWTLMLSLHHFDLLTRYDAIRITVGVMIVVVVGSELIRYFLRMKTR